MHPICITYKTTQVYTYCKYTYIYIYTQKYKHMIRDRCEIHPGTYMVYGNQHILIPGFSAPRSGRRRL